MVLLINVPTFALIAVLFGVLEGSDKENWEVHTNIVEKFPCNSPQPRSFSWKDLKSNLKESEMKIAEDISPESTVLYRCESAGCCPNDYTCRHEKKEMVNLTFLSIFPNGTTAYFNIKAVNHTKCSCQAEGDLPK